MARLDSFEYSYRNKPLTAWLGKHPAFNEGHSRHNLLANEMEAAAVFGVDPDVYSQKARDSRVAITAYVFGKNALAAMEAYDHRKKAEVEAKNRRGKKK